MMAEVPQELRFRVGDTQGLVGGAGSVPERTRDPTKSLGQESSGRLSSYGHIYR